MPPRATTDALVRLRQADVEEAITALQAVRDAAERAKSASEQATAAAVVLAERLRQAQAARTAGRLQQRERYRQKLRAELDAAHERAARAKKLARDADHAVVAAQRKLELAVRARDAVNAHRAAAEKSDARRRERREQAAADERWRPPRRS